MGAMAPLKSECLLTNLLQKNTILQVIICDDLRRGSMLNSGNNDREQNWLLLSPRVKRARSDWWATVTLGCPRWEYYLNALLNMQ
jgi:hypothetical protein